jgi:hypothetical protein
MFGFEEIAVPLKVLWLRQKMAQKAKSRRLRRGQNLCYDRPLRDPEEVLLEKEQFKIANEFLEEFFNDLFGDETINERASHRRLAYTTNGG